MQAKIQLIITADCAITAVEEVAVARGLGMDVIVSDHHSVRADGMLPDAPIVHPTVCGYPFQALVAFSGTVKDGGQSYTEANMNGFPEAQTRIAFERAEYRFLIVASATRSRSCTGARPSRPWASL